MLSSGSWCAKYIIAFLRLLCYTCYMVYMAQAQNGLVKIGTSECPERRARCLQATLLAVAPGRHRQEQVLHLLFATSRLFGEWFRPTEDLLAFAHNILPTLSSPSAIEAFAVHAMCFQGNCERVPAVVIDRLMPLQQGGPR